jgi:DNA-binding SARP family transcriptional activator
MRNLQVAISSLRQVVRSRNGVSFVERKEDAYLIALPPEADVDFLAFEGAVAAGDGARVRGDCGSAVAEYRRALGLYGGDLLAEVGPADWVVGERDRLRAQGTRAALALAELLLEAGDPAGAAEACERGLCLDRYRDALWRTLIGALQRAEGPAAAAVARSRYCEVLTELGVPPDHAQLEPA